MMNKKKNHNYTPFPLRGGGAILANKIVLGERVFYKTYAYEKPRVYRDAYVTLTDDREVFTNQDGYIIDIVSPDLGRPEASRKYHSNVLIEHKLDTLQDGQGSDRVYSRGGLRLGAQLVFKNGHEYHPVHNSGYHIDDKVFITEDGKIAKIVPNDINGPQDHISLEGMKTVTTGEGYKFYVQKLERGYRAYVLGDDKNIYIMSQGSYRLGKEYIKIGNNGNIIRISAVRTKDEVKDYRDSFKFRPTTGKEAIDNSFMPVERKKVVKKPSKPKVKKSHNAKLKADSLKRLEDKIKEVKASKQGVDMSKEASMKRLNDRVKSMKTKLSKETAIESSMTKIKRLLGL